jgi:biopolymer transport protein ExbD
MNQHHSSDSWSTGCLILLAGGMLVALCGGLALVLVSGWVYTVRSTAALPSAAFAVQTAVDDAEDGYRLAIGPDGEIFWEDRQIDLTELKSILKDLAPPEERKFIRIRILPGAISPQETIDQVRELTSEYDEVVEPLPPPLVEIAPTPDEKKDRAPASKPPP